MIRKKWIFTLVLISGYAVSSAQDLTSRWHSIEYKQDMRNIPSLDYYYENTNKLFYLISNDSENLYIHLRFTEKGQQMMVLHSGMTIWIDTTGRTKSGIGIKFPVRLHGDFSRPLMDNGESLITESGLEMELLGFEGKNSSHLIKANDNTTINGSIIYNNYHDLLYEVSIPLAGKYFNLSTFPQFSIGFEMEDNQSIPPAGGGDRSNVPPQGRGGSPNGEFSSGGPPRNGLGAGRGDGFNQGHKMPDQRSSSIKFWIRKLKLCEKQTEINKGLQR